MNKKLVFFEKIKKIEIIYFNKKKFIFFDDVPDKVWVKINDIKIDISEFKFKSKYHKQVRFEILLFYWLEKMNYIKNFKSSEGFILPVDTFCQSNKIEFKRSR
jgi:hypothetical protein